MHAQTVNMDVHVLFPGVLLPWKLYVVHRHFTSPFSSHVITVYKLSNLGNGLILLSLYHWTYVLSAGKYSLTTTLFYPTWS